MQGEESQQFQSGLVLYPAGRMNPSPSSFQAKRQQRYESLAKRAPSITSHLHPQIKQQPHQNINDRLSLLTREEVQLEREIGAINSSLEKQYRNMSYKNGLLFQYGVDYQLASVVREVQESGIEINSWGFVLEKGGIEQPQHQKAVLPKVVKIPRKLISSMKSENSEEKFKFHRYEQLPPQLINKWDYFTKGSTPKYYRRERLKTQPTHLQLPSSLSNSKFGIASYQSSLILSPHFSEPREVKRSIFQAERFKSVQRSPRSLFNPSQLHDILKKETKLISIWLPPSNSPQFFGLISVLVRQKEDGTNLCLIKKYWWVRSGLSKRIFNCLLDWLGKEYGYTDELTLLTSKQTFDSLYSPLGWTLINWIKQQKLRISYRRTLL